jgi:tetratricopeptide (TPR) repeat protein
VILKTGYEDEIIDYLDNVGKVYFDLGQYDSAGYYYQQSLHRFTKLDLNKDKISLYYVPSVRATIIYTHLCEYYAKLKDFEKALKYGEMALGMTGDIQDIEILQILYGTLYETNKALGNYKDALSYKEKFTDIKDSVLTLDKNTEVQKLLVQFETEQKDNHIQLLEKNNEIKDSQLMRSRIILFSVAGMAVMLVIIGILLSRQQRLKLNHKNLLLEQRLFRSQMNPHFIFNSLGSIQSSIISEEPDKAV